MSDTKFTPGPWVVNDTHPDGACLHISSKNDRWNTGDVATVYCAGQCDWDHNAKLIAAAPDLFAALQAVLESGCDDNSLIKANAALAMARGGSA